MADGELSRPLPPCLYADPRHARWSRLRFAVGNADEGYRTDGLDDRTPVRNRLRKARAQQAALETDHRSFRAARAQRPAVEFILTDPASMLTMTRCYRSRRPRFSHPGSKTAHAVPSRPAVQRDCDSVRFPHHKSRRFGYSLTMTGNGS